MWEVCGEVDGERLGPTARGTQPGTQGWVHIRMAMVSMSPMSLCRPHPTGCIYRSPANSSLPLAGLRMLLQASELGGRQGPKSKETMSP